MSTKKVLVTGIGGYWGNRVAQKLVENPDYKVLGLDSIAPKQPVPGMDFIQADIRNPLLVELLKSEKIDTVYHMAFKDTARPNEAAFDYNVMGTMKVFGACAAAGVKNIIFKSSTAVYGASPQNSAFLREDHPLNGSRSHGSIRYLMEIEAFCNGFRRQSPEVSLTILRFANIIGPTVDAPLVRYLKQPVSAILMGFDPMMQIIHEDDVVDALVHAGSGDYPGIFNVAAEDVMPLTKLLGLAGQRRVPVFHPFAYWGYGVFGSRGLRFTRHLPIELDYIRYRWVGDLQKMREVLGFVPSHTAEETLRQFAEQRSAKKPVLEISVSASYDADPDHLRETIERRHVSETQVDGDESLEATDE